MERGKRKRPAKDGCDEGRKPDQTAVDESNRAAPDEDEVEEFFAILRRMREVSTSLAARNNSSRRGAVEEPPRKKSGPIWRPTFTWEDFEDEGIAVKEHAGRSPSPVVRTEAGNGTPRSLDLNADPE